MIGVIKIVASFREEADMVAVEVRDRLGWERRSPELGAKNKGFRHSEVAWELLSFSTPSFGPRHVGRFDVAISINPGDKLSDTYLCQRCSQ